MPQLLGGQKALVTGAGRGIGREIARLLASEGAAVALCYRSSKAGAQGTAAQIRADGGTAHIFQADLRDEADCERLVREAAEALGGLDTLVNCAAGFGPKRLLAEADWEHLNQEWQDVMKPVALLTRAALPLFRAQKRGRIVNLAATLAYRPAGGFGAHALAKAAVIAYTKTLAREVGPEGITVNAVSPGMTLTEWTQSLPEEERNRVARRTPLRRLATASDVARAVAFFCSPWAEFVTGANLAPDGGLSEL